MIVVFGSLNLDLVMAVEALPRPGETVLSAGYQAVPGGKGANQAVAARRAGAQVRMYGMLGDDDFGRRVRESLESAGVDGAGVGTAADPTGCAAVCVDEAGENQIAAASGANLRARAAQVPDSVLGPGTTLVLQMEVDVRETCALIERAHSRGARVLLNLAPARPLPAEALKAVDVLVVNEVEAASLAQALGVTGAAPAPAGPAEVGRELAARCDLICIVILGSAGAVAYTAAGGWAVEALAITPVDTTAAGDAFVGVLAAALDSGAELPAALTRASVAAGLACLEAGAQTSLPDAQEIERRLPELAPARALARP